MAEIPNNPDTDPGVRFEVRLWLETSGAVRDTRIEIDPANADLHRTDAEAFLVQLAELDACVHEQAARIPEKAVLGWRLPVERSDGEASMSQAQIEIILTGVSFAIVLILAPGRGLLAQWLTRRRQRRQFAGEMLLVHLADHEGTPQAVVESSPDHIP